MSGRGVRGFLVILWVVFFLLVWWRFWCAWVSPSVFSRRWVHEDDIMGGSCVDGRGLGITLSGSLRESGFFTSGLGDKRGGCFSSFLPFDFWVHHPHVMG